jgi:hypothetical protein
MSPSSPYPWNIQESETSRHGVSCDSPRDSGHRLPPAVQRATALGYPTPPAPREAAPRLAGTKAVHLLAAREAAHLLSFANRPDRKFPGFWPHRCPLVLQRPIMTPQKDPHVLARREVHIDGPPTKTAYRLAGGDAALLLVCGATPHTVLPRPSGKAIEPKKLLSLRRDSADVQEPGR